MNVFIIFSQVDGEDDYYSSVQDQLVRSVQGRKEQHPMQPSLTQHFDQTNDPLLLLAAKVFDLIDQEATPEHARRWWQKLFLYSNKTANRIIQPQKPYRASQGVLGLCMWYKALCLAVLFIFGSHAHSTTESSQSSIIGNDTMPVTMTRLYLNKPEVSCI